MITYVFLLQPKEDPGVQSEFRAVIEQVEQLLRADPMVVTMQAGWSVLESTPPHRYMLVVKFLDEMALEMFLASIETEDLSARLGPLCTSIMQGELPDIPPSWPASYQFPEETGLNAEFRELVAREAQIDVRLVTNGASLAVDLNMNASRLANLAMALEARYRVEDLTLALVTTAGELQGYVRSKTARW